MNEAYRQGFISRCAERGADPDRLVKIAGRGDMLVRGLAKLKSEPIGVGITTRMTGGGTVGGSTARDASEWLDSILNSARYNSNFAKYLNRGPGAKAMPMPFGDIEDRTSVELVELAKRLRAHLSDRRATTAASERLLRSSGKV